MTEEPNGSAHQAFDDVWHWIATSVALVFRIDIGTGRCQRVSPAAAILTGHAPEEFYADSRLIGRFLHPEWRDVLAQKRAPSPGRSLPPSCEYRVTHKSGEPRWFHQQAFLVLGTDNRPEIMQGTLTDITLRKQAEQVLREKEARCRTLFEQIAIGIARVDLNGYIIDSNRAFRRLVGREERELTGLHFKHLSQAEDWEADLDWSEASRNDKKTHYRLEKRCLRKDGSMAWIDLTISPVCDERGALHYFIGTAEDITQRKRSESRCRSIIQASPMGIHLYVLDAEGRLRLTEANPAADRILGVPHLPLVGKELEEAFPGLRGTELAKRCRQICLEGGAWETDRLEYRDDRIGGTFEVYVFQAEPRVLAVLFVEISERLRAQAELQLLSAALQSAANAVLITDQGGDIVFVNQAFTSLTGYTLQEVAGLNPRFLNSGKHDRAFFQEMWTTIRAGKTWCGEITNRRKNGALFVWEQTVTPVCDSGKQPTHFIAIQQDITQRKRMEAELRHSRERFKKIFQTNPTAIAICTEGDHRFLDVNDCYLKTLGYARDELIGFTASDLGLWADEKQRARLTEDLKHQGSVSNYELQMRAKSGRVVDILSSVEPIQLGIEPCLLFINVDITARKDLENQVRQAAKMESIGTLAGGVAHDFNNLLTVIQGHVELLMMGGTIPPEAMDSLRQIATASDRAANLTQQLLTFSRKRRIQLKAIDLNEVVSNLSRMLHRIIGEDISLEVAFASNLPLVMADAGMIDQIVINLAGNARDAMPKGGRLAIRTETVALAPGANAPDCENRPGQFVMLRVQDSGSGIPPDVLGRIFEPFFTTKDVGKGTGLGLATVHGIVQQHQGWIDVESQVGEGTTFKVYLPASQNAPTATPPAPSQAGIRGGQETIFVVEDEEIVRTVARDILKLHGYRILEASSGPHALEVWKERKDEIALLVTDIVMPHGINGVDLAQRCRLDRPALKVIFTSGYASPLETHDTVLLEANNYFLQKPYSAHLLARMVREVLDQPQL